MMGQSRKYEYWKPSHDSDENSYWDFTLDYKNPLASPIFSEDDKGFGLHGTTVSDDLGGGFLIDKGAFAGVKVRKMA